MVIDNPAKPFVGVDGWAGISSAPGALKTVPMVLEETPAHPFFYGETR